MSEMYINGTSGLFVGLLISILCALGTIFIFWDQKRPKPFLSKKTGGNLLFILIPMGFFFLALILILKSITEPKENKDPAPPPPEKPNDFSRDLRHEEAQDLETRTKELDDALDKEKETAAGGDDINNDSNSSLRERLRDSGALPPDLPRRD